MQKRRPGAFCFHVCTYFTRAHMLCRDAFLGLPSPGEQVDPRVKPKLIYSLLAVVWQVGLGSSPGGKLLALFIVGTFIYHYLFTGGLHTLRWSLQKKGSVKDTADISTWGGHYLWSITVEQQSSVFDVSLLQLLSSFFFLG